MESGNIGVAESVVLSTSGLLVMGFCLVLGSITLPAATDSLSALAYSVVLAVIGTASGYVTSASVFHGVRNLVRVEGTKR